MLYLAYNCYNCKSYQSRPPARRSAVAPARRRAARPPSSMPAARLLAAAAFPHRLPNAISRTSPILKLTFPMFLQRAKCRCRSQANLQAHRFVGQTPQALLHVSARVFTSERGATLRKHWFCRLAALATKHYDIHEPAVLGTVA